MTPAGRERELLLVFIYIYALGARNFYDLCGMSLYYYARYLYIGGTRHAIGVNF